jgi:hypothetical protein
MQTELSLSTVTATQEQVDALLRALLPAQGQWSEAAYLWLTEHTARLIEFTDCYLEMLPMPTDESCSGCPRLRRYPGRVV